MATAVIVTGNHYLVDVTAGITLSVVALATTLRRATAPPLDVYELGVSDSGRNGHHITCVTPRVQNASHHQLRFMNREETTVLVLTATNELQGRAPDDYSHAVAGELVTALAAQCDDGQCGCNRGFSGLASQLATTTAVVTDLPHITELDLRDAVYDHLDRGGWIDVFRQMALADGHSECRADCRDECDECDCDANDDPAMLIEDMIDEHLEGIWMICERYPVGTVIERSGAIVRARSLPYAA